MSPRSSRGSHSRTRTRMNEVSTDLDLRPCSTFVFSVSRCSNVTGCSFAVLFCRITCPLPISHCLFLIADNPTSGAQSPSSFGSAKENVPEICNAVSAKFTPKGECSQEIHLDFLCEFSSIVPSSLGRERQEEKEPQAEPSPEDQHCRINLETF